MKNAKNFDEYEKIEFSKTEKEIAYKLLAVLVANIERRCLICLLMKIGVSIVIYIV